jgi:uncharacterized membrane protein
VEFRLRIKSLISPLPKKEMNEPLITDDAVVFGLLMTILGFVFYTSSRTSGFWMKYYKIIPALLMCYLLPSVLSTFGIIGVKWETLNAAGEVVTEKSHLYDVAKLYLLPTALVLMTLSIDLKGIFNLGPKSLAMFLTGTIGIVVGGPVAILLMSLISPETVGGAGPDAVWRGLSTLAGSWIGGGANQAAMLEIYGYNQEKYGAMVLVDIVVANIWMAFLLYGVGRSESIDRWLKADSSAIDELKHKVETYTKSISKIPNLSDSMVILGIGFTATAASHLTAKGVKWLIANHIPSLSESVLNSGFFWIVVTATTIGIVMSFTKLRKWEGAGASRIGSVFIYVLVATIGMKMDLMAVLSQPGLLVVGLIWMAFHVGLLFAVAKLIRAPYFFLAVGSKANVGGAASAPVVAAAFHPSLAPVGVLLAVLGYALGTYGAIFCAQLMELVSP